LIRVAHVLWRGDIGGIQRLVHDLAVEQRRQGIDVRVVFGQAEGPQTIRLRTEGFEVGDLGLRSGWDLRPGTIAAGRHQLEDLDVVHLHGFNFGFAAMLLRPGPVVVFTDHGFFAIGRRLGLNGRLKRLAQNWFLRRRAVVIAANSEHTASRMCAVHGLPRDQIRVVHNGVAAPVESTPRIARSDGRLTVAFVGRLVRFKRIDRLIRALAMLDRPDEIRALIVGAGPLDAELQSFARSQGVEGSIDFIGAVDDVADILREVDVVVQPSQEEPFGLAVLEGCREGCLPIAFADGGGVLEVLPPDGVVVGDERELAAAFTRLVGSAAVTEDARRNRAEWARRTFSVERMAEHYLELYRTALGGGVHRDGSRKQQSVFSGECQA
jgi:glycosyltransferase involved in cell wall biosynthesis